MSHPARAGRKRTHWPAALRVVQEVVEPDDDELDARVAAYAEAADADNTVRTYLWAWNRFTDWCQTHGATALPASSKVVDRFLVTAVEDPVSPAGKSSLEVLRAAIAWQHDMAGLPDPTDNAKSRKVREGLRKAIVKKGETLTQAPAATLDHIEAMVETARADAHTLRQQVSARRDIALILLGYDFGRRGDELVRLQIGDLTVVQDNPEGKPLLRMRLRGGKTHQTDTVYMHRPRGSRDGRTCTWCALARWIAVLAVADDAAAGARGHDAEAVTAAVSIAVQRLILTDTRDVREHCCQGDWLARARSRASLFRPLSNGGFPHAPDRPLSVRSFRSIITSRGRAADRDGLKGHSLRAGVATELFDRGATVEQVMAITGHRNPASALRYDRRRNQRSAELETGL
ncbi:tyrosine-type recombinase/integrase [Nocardia sp. 2]|uniref:Tyrosine-type recombinase/integrase n=1 Tax=Nocardia acididurans TaxID=2802282 RepID=A0ABS1MGP3_9NOCA|nr:tyrosine-type recombinase/integrase [Nocardia acididurans]MBL1079732.1 tyrosine-type recombinase/integrase [Nocardia acididurans]